MNSARPSFRHRAPLVCAVSIALFTAAAPAQTITKANNTNDLNLGSSWAGGIAPTAAETALWDATVTGVNLVSLGGDLAWLGLRIANPGGTVTINAGGSLTLGTGGIDMAQATQNLTLANTVTLGATQDWNVAEGRTLTVSGVIGGGGGLTKLGAGTLTLSAANTYTGPTAVNRGTLALNFAAAGAPLTDILGSGSALTLGGGTLTVQGAAGAANLQSVVSTTLTAGLSTISVANGAGGTATLALGSLAAPIANLGAAVRFNGPATIDNLGNVAATGTITTLTAGTGGAVLPFGNLGTFNTPGQVAGYATVGLYDFASTNLADSGGAGTSPYTIIGGSQVTGFYTATTPGNATSVGNWDMQANTMLTGGERRASTLRFNTPGANTLTFTSGGSATLMTLNSILVTPNMGAQNVTFTTGAGTFMGGWQIIRATAPPGQQEGIIWQNNTLGFLNFNAALMDGRDAGDTNHVVKAGPGTYAPNLVGAPGFYTGQTFLLEGVTLITGNKDIGNPASAGNLNLNGGTLIGNDSLALDNAGLNQRPVLLGSNGGGLAATTGNTMTVPGSVSGVVGSGPLTIGYGTVAGSGVGTANPTPIVGDGKVLLTGANTFSSGTVANAGTLAINGINALGGANYGGLTLNGAALQYAATLTSDSDLTTGRGLTIGASGATIDTNGNSVSFLSGLPGAGGLIKTGAGTLTLNSPGTYAGGTVVSGGRLKVASASGSATGPGSVTVNNLATLAGTGTIGGAVTIDTGGTLEPGASVGVLTLPGLTLATDSLLRFEFNISPANDLVNVTGSNGLTINGGKFSVFLEGTTTPWNVPGTYNLLSFAGAVQGTGIGALSVVNPAAGFGYTFATTGSFVTLTVASTGLSSNWAVAGGGSWGTAANWSNGVPDQIGATANLGSAITTPATVTLDGTRTAGAVTFDNANAYTVVPGTGGSLTLQTASGSAGLMVISGSHAINAPLILGSNLAADVIGGGVLSISGAMSGAQSLTKRGGGVLVLNAANNHVGTTIEAGTVEIGNSAALGPGGVSVTGSASLRAGVDGLAPTNNLTLGSAVTATIDTQASNLTLPGIIGDTAGNGAVTKTGTGTLVLSGPNTYGGATTVSGGILTVLDLQNGGLASNLGQSSSSAANLVLNGTTLRYAGAGSATDRLFTVGTAGATLDSSGSGPLALNSPGALVLAGADTARTLTLTGSNAGANTLAATLGNNSAGATSLAKSGIGTWLLSGANTFSGATTVSGGTLALGHPLALQNSTLDYNNLGGALTFDTLGAATLGALQGTQNLPLVNTLLGGVALTLGGNNANTTYSGVLSDTGSLTKVGTGILTLSGVSTFTGPTTISAGGLYLTTSNALSGTNNIFDNVPGGLRLANGVSIASPISIATGANEFVDVPDGGAAATLAGPVVTVGSTQYRLGISGAGATLTVTGVHTLGGGTTISFITRGNIVFAQSGALNINPANDTFQFGRFGGQQANITFKDSASLTTGAIGIGGGQAGGPVTLTVQDNAAVTAALGKNFDFHGINADVSVTINLNGGALTAGSFTKFQASVARPTFLNLNGGVITAGAANVNFLPELTGLSVNVQAGGAKFDTAGFDVTVAHPLVHDAIVATDGGLTKLGAGTLTLAGAETYNGPTVVNAGTLLVSGSLTGSLLVTANTGGELQLGASDVLNEVDLLTLAGGTLDTAGFSESVGALAVSGAATIDLGAGASVFHFTASNASPWTGSLSITNWSGLTSGGGTDQLFFGADANGLSAGQIALAQFIDPAGFAPGSYGAQLLATGELVAIPEPSPALVLAGFVPLLGLRRRRAPRLEVE